jgi:hypothetical protein
MKKLLVCALSALVLLSFSTMAGRADLFDRMENSPDTYWVPAPTPGYLAGAPQPYYYGPPPPPGYYYGAPPPPAPVIFIPRFFIGFHFH